MKKIKGWICRDMFGGLVVREAGDGATPCKDCVPVYKLPRSVGRLKRAKKAV